MVDPARRRAPGTCRLRRDALRRSVPARPRGNNCRLLFDMLPRWKGCPLVAALQNLATVISLFRWLTSDRGSGELLLVPIKAILVECPSVIEYRQRYRVCVILSRHAGPWSLLVRARGVARRRQRRPRGDHQLSSPGCDPPRARPRNKQLKGAKTSLGGGLGQVLAGFLPNHWRRWLRALAPTHGPERRPRRPATPRRGRSRPSSPAGLIRSKTHGHATGGRFCVARRARHRFLPLLTQ